jgi:phage portal protein BeeE
MSAQFMENIEIQYDPDSISALNSQRQILWQNLNNTHFLTDEEKRAMLGFNTK